MESSQYILKAFRPKMSSLFCLLIILIGLAPLAFVTSIVVDRFPVPYREKVDAHLAETVHKHALLVDRFMQDTLHTVRLLAASADGKKLSDSDQLSQWLELLKRIHGGVFEDIGFVDDTGLQVAYAGPLALHGARYAGAEWFEAARKVPHFISDVFPGLRKYPHFIVATRKTWENRQWILRATIDFNAFTTLVEELRIGRTGRAFIMNRSGALQTHPNTSVLDPEVYLSCAKSGRPLAGGAVRLIETADEPSGTEKILLTAELNGGKWLLVFQQEISDSLSDLLRNIKVAGMFFVVGFVAVVTLAFVIRVILEVPSRENG